MASTGSMNKMSIAQLISPDPPAPTSPVAPPAAKQATPTPAPAPAPVFDPNSQTVDLEIPISTHYDIHTEFNFPWLVQEKYGVSLGGIKLRNANKQDQDDDDVDDDEEEEEEAGDEEEEVGEEEDDFIDDSKAASAASAASVKSYNMVDDHQIVKLLGIQFDEEMSDSQKEALVLNALSKREAKNNQRLGKYDFDDPFIDDEELEVEEQQQTHINGWFIWHGNLKDNTNVDIAKVLEQYETPAADAAEEVPAQEVSSGSKRRNGNSEFIELEPKKYSKKKKTATVAATATATATSTSEPETTPAPVIVNSDKPVVANSETKSNQIIIGSFQGFS